MREQEGTFCSSGIYIYTYKLLIVPSHWEIRPEHGFLPPSTFILFFPFSRDKDARSRPYSCSIGQSCAITNNNSSRMCLLRAMNCRSTVVPAHTC